MKDLSLKTIIEEIAKGYTITIKENEGDIVIGEISEDRTIANSQIFKNRYLKDLMKDDKRRNEPKAN